jgi:hypothetical protein
MAADISEDSSSIYTVFSHTSYHSDRHVRLIFETYTKPLVSVVSTILYLVHFTKIFQAYNREADILG